MIKKKAKCLTDRLPFKYQIKATLSCTDLLLGFKRLR